MYPKRKVWIFMVKTRIAPCFRVKQTLFVGFERPITWKIRMPIAIPYVIRLIFVFR